MDIVFSITVEMPWQNHHPLLHFWICVPSICSKSGIRLYKLFVSFYFFCLFLVFRVKNFHNDLLRLIVLNSFIFILHRLQTILHKVYERLVKLWTIRTWLSWSAVRFHLLGQKPDSIAKHFVSDVFVKIDVQSFDWSWAVLLLVVVKVVGYVMVSWLVVFLRL